MGGVNIQQNCDTPMFTKYATSENPKLADLAFIGNGDVPISEKYSQTEDKQYSIDQSHRTLNKDFSSVYVIWFGQNCKFLR